MKNSYILIALCAFIVIPITVLTHQVNLSDTDTTAKLAENISSIDQTLENNQFSDNELYELLYAIKGMQSGPQTVNGREVLFGFNSSKAEQLFRDIKNSYTELLRESKEKADEFLGHVLVKLSQE